MLDNTTTAARSLKRQSLAAADLAQELRLMREARRAHRAHPPVRQGETPFDDDAELARLWREESRRSNRKNGRQS